MGETPQPEGVAVERVVSLQPAAWLYQVRFTGEDGRQATDWHNYGVYQSKADAEHGMKNAGNGLGCRVVPLYDAEIFATWLDAEHKRRKHRDNFAAVLAKRFRTEVLQPNAGVER